VSPDRESKAKLRTPDVIARKESLPPLTGLRFLAAAYVVVYHFPDILPKNLAAWAPISEFLDKGYLGVSLFFCFPVSFLRLYIRGGSIPGMIIVGI
jgi:hypothetical protein